MPTKLKTKRTPRGAKRRLVAVGEYLVVDPRVCHGQLTFRGTRVPVAAVLYCLSTGNSIDYVRKSWPEVPTEAIHEAMRLASEEFIRHHS